MAAGERIEQIGLQGGGLTASIVSVGAAIQDLRLDGHPAPLVLGYADPEAYRTNTTYFGAVAGRYANRIRDGRFTIDGAAFETPRNFIGKHTLHGGSNGFSTRNWTVSARSDDAVTLQLVDENGTEGFPGRLDVRVTYRLSGAGTLRTEFEAETDRPTLCNLAQHSYFNLDDGGSDTIFDHALQIDADAYLPVDDELIPTGRVEPVQGTAFDFRASRPIRSKTGDGFYDHNFCLGAARVPLRRVVQAKGAQSGVAMELWTTEPGVQFYSGAYIETDHEGLDGRRYDRNTGFCLEPQTWPDSPHRPYFPQAVLRPGEVYRQETEYRFRKA